MNSIFSLSNIIAEFRSSTKLAMPLVASEVIYALNGFMATVMVAHLGKEQLAANALVWSIYIAVILFFIGMLCAVGVMVAQSFGAKDDLGISICFKQGLILAVIFAVPMMIIMWCIPIVLVWAKQDPVVINHAKPFFYSLAWVMLPQNVGVVMHQFLVGINRPKLVLFMCILAVPIEIFFYYAFLFGKFGLPKLGLPGIGYGLAVSNFVLSLFLICNLYFSKGLKIYSLFDKWWRIEYKFLAEMFRVGLPLGFMWCSEVLFFAVVAMMMGTFGVTVLAAYQISYQYLMIALIILFALNQSVSVRVGNEVGRNNRDQLKLTVVVNMLIGFSLISMFSISYIVAPEFVMRLDIDPNAANFQAVAREAVKFFPIVGIFLITDCVRLVTCGALRGLKDTHFQMYISLFGFWVIAFPCSYLLAFKYGFGGVGIWWGVVFGLFITGIMFLIRFKRIVNDVDLLSLVTKKG